MRDAQHPIETVVFKLEKTTWHTFLEEGIPAHRLESGLFKLVAAPFFFKGVSCGDIVIAEHHADGLAFRRVVEKGGHSTYRIVSEHPPEYVEATDNFRSLIRLGCGIQKGELHFGPIYAIDVPPHCSVQDAFDALNRGQSACDWMFEEAAFGHEIEP